MDCQTAHTHFSDYYEKELPANLREHLQRHFSSCNSCLRDYDEFIAGIEMLSSTPLETADDHFTQQVMMHVRREALAPRRSPQTFKWVSLAACLLLSFYTVNRIFPKTTSAIETPTSTDRLSSLDPELLKLSSIQGTPMVWSDSKSWTPVRDQASLRTGDLITATEPSVINLGAAGSFNIRAGDLIQISRDEDGRTHFVAYRASYEVVLHDDRTEIYEQDKTIVRTPNGNEMVIENERQSASVDTMPKLKQNQQPDFNQSF